MQGRREGYEIVKSKMAEVMIRNHETHTFIKTYTGLSEEEIRQMEISLQQEKDGDSVCAKFAQTTADGKHTNTN